MKRTLFSLVFFVGLFVTALFLAPTGTSATTNLTLDRLYVCYNSKYKTKMLDIWGHSCYSGNWRIRGLISNNASQKVTGFYTVVGDSSFFDSRYLRYSYRPLETATFTLNPYGNLATNYTTTWDEAILCSRGILFVVRAEDGGGDHKYSISPDKIPSCF